MYLYLRTGIINSSRLLDELVTAIPSITNIQLQSDNQFTIYSSSQLDQAGEDKIDEIILSHDPTPTYGLTNEDNIPVVTNSYQYYPDGLYPKFKGYQFTAIAGARSFFDVEITDEKKLQRGSFSIWNCADVALGDFLEFTLVDKNDVLGLFSQNGLVVGQDILELDKYIETYPVRPWEHNAILGTEGAKSVMPGLFFRWVYDSNGTTDIEILTELLTYVK